jgi:hypothetical protein
VEEQLYRRQRPWEIVLSGDDIMNSYEVDTECGDVPPDPIRPVSVWRCKNEAGCPCDEVRIRETYRFTAPPKERPGMKCPRCGLPMQFWHYASVGLLMPVCDRPPLEDWLASCLSKLGILPPSTSTQ